MAGFLDLSPKVFFTLSPCKSINLYHKSRFLSVCQHCCHFFCISVIPSEYCHSFRILLFLPNIVILSELFRELQILTSSKSFPYPKGEKNGHRRWPYMRVSPKCRNRKLNLKTSLARPDQLQNCWLVLITIFLFIINMLKC